MTCTPEQVSQHVQLEYVSQNGRNHKSQASNVICSILFNMELSELKLPVEHVEFCREYDRFNNFAINFLYYKKTLQSVG